MTAASNNSHMRRVRFYEGKIPVEVHFDDLQDPAYDALKRVQTTYVSENGRPLAAQNYTINASFVLALDPNAAIDNTGLSIDWPSVTNVDCSSSTAGSYVGTTTPGAGQKKYILVAAKHEIAEGTPEVSPKNGLTYQYDKSSTVTFEVYALSADAALADDWFANSALASLFDDAVTDGAVPLLICERRDGTTTFTSDDIHEITKTVWAQGSPEADRDHNLYLMSEMFGAIAPDGIVKTPSAVVGQPGRLTITGGDAVLFALEALGSSSLEGKYKSWKVVETTIPATVLDFASLSTTYIVRAKIDVETETVEVYHGTMTTDYPNEPVAGQFGRGSDGGTALGFIRTGVDIPIAIVTTLGSNNTVPTVVNITPTSQWNEWEILSANNTTGYYFDVKAGDLTMGDLSVGALTTSAQTNIVAGAQDVIISGTNVGITGTNLSLGDVTISGDILDVDSITMSAGQALSVPADSYIHHEAIMRGYLRIVRSGGTWAVDSNFTWERITGFSAAPITITENNNDGTVTAGLFDIDVDFSASLFGTNNMVVEAQIQSPPSIGLVWSIHTLQFETNSVAGDRIALRVYVFEPGILSNNNPIFPNGTIIDFKFYGRSDIAV